MVFFQPPNKFFQENYQNCKFYLRIRRVDEKNSLGVEKGEKFFPQNHPRPQKIQKND